MSHFFPATPATARFCKHFDFLNDCLSGMLVPSASHKSNGCCLYILPQEKCLFSENMVGDNGRNHSQADVSLIPSHNFVLGLQVQPLDFYWALLTSWYSKHKPFNHFLNSLAVSTEAEPVPPLRPWKRQVLDGLKQHSAPRLRLVASEMLFIFAHQQ